MEVHAHTHTERKKFTHYLWEFLMLFLAVFCGFLAENFREHQVEKKREKKYVLNIIKDLAADTANLNRFIPILLKRIAQDDTLISMLQSPGNTDHGSDLYYYARLSTQTLTFQATKNTITELKNSGNFRLITRQNVINGLTVYQQTIDNYVNLNTVEIKEAELLYPFLGNLFDASVFENMYKKRVNELTSSPDSITNLRSLDRPPGNPQMRNRDQDIINQLIFHLHERKGSFIGEILLLKKERNEASRLIQLINKEYQLE